MTVAIHYTSVKPRKENDREVFGVQVAIGDLLKAFFRHTRQEKIAVLIGTADEKNEIDALATEAGIDPARLIALDRRFPEKNLTSFGTVFRAEPDTRRLLWQRQLGGSFSFCGLAHAISGVEAGEVLQDYCLSPSEETDAIICPSHAVKNAIHTFWDAYGNYLGKRFGTTYRCPVSLPVIPLGIDIEKFEVRTTPDKRAAQRQALGLDDDAIVLLWVGRLSAAIKAHPLALFQAAERAASTSKARIHLVMVGYFVPLNVEPAFKKLAAETCPSVDVSFIPANDPRFPDGLWAAGDIFLSLVDNIQESFGLTPIEAMACGLPRVISDWDGYRDSVADGEDGFLIRTTQPPPGNGFDLTAQVLSGQEVYGGFLAKTALTVAVDAEQAGDRIAALIADKNLRAAIAQKAKARVRAHYDWKHIIPAYENLWNELAAQRKNGSTPEKEAYTSALPQLPDPYTMYATYPTTALDADDRLSLVLPVESIQALLNHPINTYANDVLAAPQEITGLLGWISNNPGATIASALERHPLSMQARLWRTLAWLQKLGIVKIELAKRFPACRV